MYAKEIHAFAKHNTLSSFIYLYFPTPLCKRAAAKQALLFYICPFAKHS